MMSVLWLAQLHFHFKHFFPDVRTCQSFVFFDVERLICKLCNFSRFHTRSFFLSFFLSFWNGILRVHIWRFGAEAWATTRRFRTRVQWTSSCSSCSPSSHCASQAGEVHSFQSTRCFQNSTAEHIKSPIMCRWEFWADWRFGHFWWRRHWNCGFFAHRGCHRAVYAQGNVWRW